MRLLGHPVRLAMLDELAHGPKCVTDIQDLLEISVDRRCRDEDNCNVTNSDYPSLEPFSRNY